MVDYKFEIIKYVTLLLVAKQLRINELEKQADILRSIVEKQNKRLVWWMQNSAEIRDVLETTFDTLHEAHGPVPVPEVSEETEIEGIMLAIKTINNMKGDLDEQS